MPPRSRYEAAFNVLAATTAGVFLPHFHHAQVAFRLVVVEAQPEVSQEGDPFVFMLALAHDQMVLGALFGPA